jgi:peptidoglycan hydrolase CwlO-like protein
MKKKIITLSLALVLLFLALVILTVVPQALQAKDPLPDPFGGTYGQWIYDTSGNHIGCKSPGSDCTWG